MNSCIGPLNIRPVNGNLVIPILIIALVLGGFVIERVTNPPNQPPAADFDYLTGEGGTTVHAGMRVSFYNKSKDPEGKAVSSEWNFDDGKTSTEEAPSHVFFDPRDYSVVLRVADEQGNSSSKKTMIRVLPAGPVASFEASPSNPVTGNPVVFVDQSFHPSKNAIVKKTWVFDLAEPSVAISRGGSEFREERVYSRPGTYKVQLTVEDDQGLVDSCIREVVVSDLATSVARLDQSIAGLNTSIEELRLQIKESGITLSSISEAMVSLDKEVTKVIDEYKEKGMSALAWTAIIIALLFGAAGVLGLILQIIASRRSRQQT